MYVHTFRYRKIGLYGYYKIQTVILKVCLSILNPPTLTEIIMKNILLCNRTITLKHFICAIFANQLNKF